MKTEREKLIEELISVGGLDYIKQAEEIADFMLEDRKRIVKPLINYQTSPPENPYEKNGFIYAINETLKNAGVEI